MAQLRPGRTCSRSRRSRFQTTILFRIHAQTGSAFTGYVQCLNHVKLLPALLSVLLLSAARACDLCAIYNAGDALGRFESGLSFTLGEQYIPYRTTQFN